jgi:two-component system OmpR family sensor kinase
MRESLRARLLFWHAATGAAIVLAFGASVCVLVWHTRLAAIDATLAAHAAQLEDAVLPTEQGQVDLILGPGLRQPDAAGVYHFIWTRDGVLIDRSSTDLPTPVPPVDGARFAAGHRELAATAASGVRLLVGMDLASLRGDIWSLAMALLVTGSAILLVSVGSGWWFMGHALAPLDRINRTARRMSEGDLSARIPSESVDTEVGQIVVALNDAFDRLHEAVARQRRFTADASHELRTPLATLSTEVQWALARPRSADDLRSSLEVCARAAGRMQAVIERLLFLARGEAVAVRTAPVRLDDIAREAVEHVRALSYAAGLAVTLDAEPATIEADSERLLEAVTNVLTNAVRYNVPDGQVSLRVTSADEQAVLEVRDTGIGIPAADLPHVFDAFFRGDPARSRDTGGAGLGLAVARAVVEQHGGTIECSSAPGEGTTIRMRWPAGREAA